LQQIITVGLLTTTASIHFILPAYLHLGNRKIREFLTLDLWEWT